MTGRFGQTVELNQVFPCQLFKIGDNLNRYWSTGAAAESQRTEVVFKTVVLQVFNHHGVNKGHAVKHGGALFFDGA